VRIYHWIIQTAAWKSLNGNQRAIYIELAARYAGPGSNNGKIHYSVREAADSLRIGKSTAARDLRALQERGFIVPMTKGAFSVKVKIATTWRLTEFPCDVTHKSATKDFTRWTPEIQNTVPAQNTTVPTVAPIGTRSGTEVTEMSRNGIRGGTVNPIATVRRYPQGDMYSLPGGLRLKEGSN
jgi:hypothetical protein